MAATKKKRKISFLLFPAPLGQICFVLVLISLNHKARNRYPEMVMARTVKLTEMMCRSRRRRKKDDIGRIRYKKQIDFTGSNEHFTPITKLKPAFSSQSI